MNDEQPPTAFGPSLVGAVNELSRATWPVVPSLLAAVLVAVFGLSFLAILSAWVLFVLWLYVGITREAGSGAAVLGVVSRLVRFGLAVTAAASAVAGVVAGFQMDERAFFLGFSAVTALVGGFAAYALTFGWTRRKGMREAIPAALGWAWLCGAALCLTVVDVPVFILQATAHAFAALVAAALIVRLFSIASSPARLVFGLTACAVLLELGVFLLVPDVGIRGGIGAGDSLWLAAPVVAGLVFVIGEAASGRGARGGAIGAFWRTSGRLAPLRERLAPTGFVLGLVAVGVIAQGSLIAALSPRLLDANFSSPVELESPDDLVYFSSDGRPTDEELALRFSPVLLTGKDERRPVTVDRFLDASSLERVDGTRAREVDESVLGHSTCPPGLPASCYRLRPHCGSASHEGCDIRDAGFGNDRTPVYARVFHRRASAGDHRQSDEQRWVFRRAARSLTALIQYWYFYAYDDWVGETVWGEIDQSHEGDWEAVTVGLSIADDGSFTRVSLLFAGASAHCGGTRKDRFVDVTTGPIPARYARTEDPVPTHPVIYVARGSQANYFDGRVRTPDWASCLGIGNPDVAAASTVYNLREQFGNDRVLRSSETSDLRLVTSASPIIRFPGRWGSRSNLALTTVTGRRFPRPGDGAPPSPGQQSLWIDPMATIFCDGRWRLSRYRGETVYVPEPTLWRCPRNTYSSRTASTAPFAAPMSRS